MATALSAVASFADEAQGHVETATIYAPELLGWTHDPPVDPSVPVFLGSGPSPDELNWNVPNGWTYDSAMAPETTPVTDVGSSLGALDGDIDTSIQSSTATVYVYETPEPSSLLLAILGLLAYLLSRGSRRRPA
jgi:hypothetical protein